jgi:hypothetical protein
VPQYLIIGGNGREGAHSHDFERASVFNAKSAGGSSYRGDRRHPCLIGLGGAEYRLPILIGMFALYPHRAVRTNLLISLATLAMSAGVNSSSRF